jgi:hypothetical protein
MLRMLQFETRIAFASERTPIRIENNVQQLSLQRCVQEVWTLLKETARSFETVVPTHSQTKLNLHKITNDWNCDASC